MIGAFGTIFIACWVYQACKLSDSKHTGKWVVFLTVFFFAIQVLWNMADAFYVFSDTRPVIEPLITGFIIVALIRNKLIMREKLTLGNLFSHLNIFTTKVGKNTSEF